MSTDALLGTWFCLICQNWQCIFVFIQTSFSEVMHNHNISFYFGKYLHLDKDLFWSLLPYMGLLLYSEFTEAATLKMRESHLSVRIHNHLVTYTDWPHLSIRFFVGARCSWPSSNQEINALSIGWSLFSFYLKVLPKVKWERCTKLSPIWCC